MNKIVRILFAVVLAAVITGCTDSRNKFTVTGGGVGDIRIGSPISAVLNLDFSNPSYLVKVSDISGKVKSEGNPLLDLKAEDFVIPARSDTKVPVTVEASMEPGVGLLKVMKIIGGGDFDGLTVDLTFTATGFLGIKKTKTIEDIPLKDIVGML